MSDAKLLTTAELAGHVSGRLIGDGSVHIARVADVAAAGSGEITYVQGHKFFEAAKATGASCLIAPQSFVEFLGTAVANHEFGPAIIEVEKPKLAFALVARLLHPGVRRDPFVHASAVIAPTAEIDLTVFIGPHVAIGEGSQIAAG